MSAMNSLFFQQGDLCRKRLGITVPRSAIIAAQHDRLQLFSRIVVFVFTTLYFSVLAYLSVTWN